MADYNYWRQFGFAPELCRSFEKLGIRSIDELKALAPRLENDYGLDGLCNLLGVVNPAHVKKEEPEKHTVGGGSSGGLSSSIAETVFSKSFIIVVALILLVSLAVWLGIEVGFINGKADISFSAEAAEYIDMDKLYFKAISKDMSRDDIVAYPDENGHIMFDAPYSVYEMYMYYDGMAFSYGDWTPRIMATDARELDPRSIIFRTVLVKFIDRSGQVIFPETLTVKSTEGKEYALYPADTSRHCVLLDYEIGNEYLVFTVDDYPPVTISENWNSYRLSELTVVLG